MEPLSLEKEQEMRFAMDPEKERKRWLAAVDTLHSHGFHPIGRWLFIKDGKTYDLSAADLSQIKRIEEEGLFLVDNPFQDRFIHVHVTD